MFSVLADIKCQYHDTNNLHYLFISSPELLKGRNCTVAVFLRHILQSAPQSHFQFQGVDRKQKYVSRGGEGVPLVNYKVSTREEGSLWWRGGTRGMCLIEKRSQSMLSSSIEGSAGRSWGWYLKSYFPSSPSLTRMHDKAFCQQGQEEGSQLLPQSQSGYLGTLTILCREKNQFCPRFHDNRGPSQTQVYVLCVMDFFLSLFFLTLLWCPSVAAFNFSRAEQSNGAQKPE